ncbi:hypothetical protein C1645_815629 [Glomus cerebriforme]|uniref:Uncharacterized protein n=1 Tax=Glomus cerebriforme TaxID=658196 RepID=A0A397TN48_9GLOM|nr:hypothetical protein C1645_815629 [Glomus cerebriforme]
MKLKCKECYNGKRPLTPESEKEEKKVRFNLPEPEDPMENMDLDLIPQSHSQGKFPKVKCLECEKEERTMNPINELGICQKCETKRLALERYGSKITIRQCQVCKKHTDSYESRAGGDIVCGQECNNVLSIMNMVHKDKSGKSREQLTREFEWKEENLIPNNEFQKINTPVSDFEPQVDIATEFWKDVDKYEVRIQEQENFQIKLGNEYLQQCKFIEKFRREIKRKEEYIRYMNNEHEDVVQEYEEAIKALILENDGENVSMEMWRIFYFTLQIKVSMKQKYTKINDTWHNINFVKNIGTESKKFTNNEALLLKLGVKTREKLLKEMNRKTIPQLIIIDGVDGVGGDQTIPNLQNQILSMNGCLGGKS